MELKDISNENDKLISEPINLAFDRLEEQDFVFCSFQYKKEKNSIDKDSPKIWSKNIIELTQQEDIYPLEQIFIEEGLLPKDFHFSTLNLSILKKMNSSMINPLDFRMIGLSIDNSKLVLDEKSYPNIAISYPSLLGLFFKFEVKRLRGISYHDEGEYILETKDIGGEIRSSDRNFNTTKYLQKRNYLKKSEIEGMKRFISSKEEVLKQKKQMKEFSNLEIRFINWAAQLLERKGL